MPACDSGQFQLGSWLTLLDPAATELMAGSGFDLLVADGEHGPIATADLVQMLIATRAAGVPILYRVAANEPVRIMHALDAGASGVVVPQIRTVADTEKAVAWTRYPPVGLRGIAPRRASEYGRHTAELPRHGQRPRDLLRPDRDARGARGPRRDPGRGRRRHRPHRPERPGGRARPHRRPRPRRQSRMRSGTSSSVRGRTPSRSGSGPCRPPRSRARREQGFAWATLGTDYGFMLAAAEAAAREARQT